MEIPHIFVNGDRYNLMEDYRFDVFGSFKENTVLVDPQYTPPRRVILGEGDDAGITISKLQPGASYHAFTERNGALFPLRKRAACLYLTHIPPPLNVPIISRYFNQMSLGLIAKIDLQKNKSRGRVVLAENYKMNDFGEMLNINGFMVFIHQSDKDVFPHTEYAPPPRYGQEEGAPPSRLAQRSYGGKPPLLGMDNPRRVNYTASYFLTNISPADAKTIVEDGYLAASSPMFNDWLREVEKRPLYLVFRLEPQRTLFGIGKLKPFSENATGCSFVWTSVGFSVREEDLRHMRGDPSPLFHTESDVRIDLETGKELLAHFEHLSHESPVGKPSNRYYNNTNDSNSSNNMNGSHNSGVPDRRPMPYRGMNRDAPRPRAPPPTNNGNHGGGGPYSIPSPASRRHHHQHHYHQPL